ncbi:GntR family transcriptional regulator [Clostridium sp. PL3]|uniref:GntR family transcriptional regulator n=1 Tax=Clostridium thailandense TaxID=2794346 RepID=A0A949U1B5_9CLOT|nr:GntR family transcriptional regulator [Clostridium thailandense]MBV7276548.1 GntR family transcriptional regulator [Clostridium thailandense]
MKKSNLGEQAYEHIKDMILNLEIKPGERIPEESIANQLGSSRTPIREALRKLENDGLIFLYPKCFAEVAHYNEDTIRQIGELRLAQDILSAQLALHYGSNADFSNLRQLAQKCEDGARTGNIHDRIKLDMDFHLGITKISRNQILIKSQQELYLRIHLIQVSKYTDIEHSLKQIQHHQELIEALINRDSEKARKVICNHLKDFFNIDNSIIEQYV